MKFPPKFHGWIVSFGRWVASGSLAMVMLSGNQLPSHIVGMWQQTAAMKSGRLAQQRMIINSLFDRSAAGRLILNTNKPMFISQQSTYEDYSKHQQEQITHQSNIHRKVQPDRGYVPVPRVGSTRDVFGNSLKMARFHGTWASHQRWERWYQDVLLPDWSRYKRPSKFRRRSSLILLMRLPRRSRRRRLNPRQCLSRIHHLCLQSRIQPNLMRRPRHRLHVHCRNHRRHLQSYWEGWSTAPCGSEKWPQPNSRTVRFYGCTICQG